MRADQRHNKLKDEDYTEITPTVTWAIPYSALCLIEAQPHHD
ncbi:hypothetical protein yruck0001_3150 [Yersinia ruckeri ATCC 29473]|nr:hypothetical protein yruck0001_3150 [Yersinia ruckeri ATCC 29473]